MDCEQKCYAKLKEDEHKLKEQEQQDERKRLVKEATEDLQLIRNRYSDLLLSIKNHNNKYDETVYIDGNNIKVYSNTHNNGLDDPFYEFAKEFNKDLQQELSRYY